MVNWPTKKLGISISKAKALALKDKEAMDKFYKKHWLSNVGNEEITIILKSHLYIENLIDEILSYVLPNPQKILNYKFSSKVDMFEVLNITPSKLIIEKIREVNKIRNAFSHNLNEKLLKSDLGVLIKGIKIKKDGSSVVKLRAVFMYIIGYLHAFRTICKLFPFAILFSACKENFKKDKGICIDQIKNIYPTKEVGEILESMRL